VILIFQKSIGPLYLETQLHQTTFVNLFDSNLTQLIDTPTHTCDNILHLVLTNCPEQISNLLVHPPQYQCVSSDHHQITFSVAFRYCAPSPSIREVFNFKRGDYAGLSEYLLSYDFSTFYNLSDIDEMWYILKRQLFIPKARLRTRQFHVWFTSQLRHSLKCLHTLQRKFNKHPTPSNLECLTKAQESFHASHTAAKSEYEQNLVCNFVINKDPKIFQDLTKTRVLPP